MSGSAAAAAASTLAPIPDDAKLWDSQRVVRWLQEDAGAAAAQYCDVFAAAHIKGEDLLELAELELEHDLGIKSSLKRKQILTAILKLKAVQPRPADDSPRSKYTIYPQPEQISLLNKTMADSWAKPLKQGGDRLVGVARVFNATFAHNTLTYTHGDIVPWHL